MYIVRHGVDAEWDLLCRCFVAQMGMKCFSVLFLE